MANLYENNVAETKATFAEKVSKKNNNPTGPVSDQAKYEVSKNALKNGFSSKRFIIYGENKKEYEQYRDGLLSELKPINSIHVDICFQIIMTGWNIKRLNNSRNGVYNLETKQTLENSFNIENIHPQDLAQFLNEDNICIRVGHHCAQPLLETLNETSTARASFYIYNDFSDIDKLVYSIKSTISYF